DGIIPHYALRPVRNTWFRSCAHTTWPNLSLVYAVALLENSHKEAVIKAFFLSKEKLKGLFIKPLRFQ
ncbi:MAG: hypothetical protein M3Z49_11470, partial [Bifidobacteriales bacterium]|nr:hypothetical protein [Bifidobacteriales bacterium]